MKTGDQLFVISVKKGVVYVLAHIRVDQKLQSYEAAAQYPAIMETQPQRCGGCAGDLVVGDKGTPLHYNRIFPSWRLASWNYETPAGQPRPLNHLDDGKLIRISSMDSVYRLTADTGLELRGLFDLQAIEGPRIDDPWDKRAAALLADNWDRAGDPRGAVMRLEMEMLGAEPGAHKILIRKHRAVVKKHRPDLMGRPGGFPFSRSWGPPLRWLAPKSPHLPLL